MRGLIFSPAEAVAWLEEPLSGDDLSDCADLPWPEDAVHRLGLQLSEGLAVLHGESIVHRDLSASNVRRLDDGNFVVMDPGFARHLSMPGITVGGQPGTRGYMSPEHLIGSGPTPASDVFNVGILMYLAATSRLPIPWEGNDGEYAARLLASTFEPVANFRPGLSVNLTAVIEQCLHKQPARRFRNGAALAKALEAAA